MSATIRRTVGAVTRRSCAQRCSLARRARRRCTGKAVSVFDDPFQRRRHARHRRPDGAAARRPSDRRATSRTATAARSTNSPPARSATSRSSGRRLQRDVRRRLHPRQGADLLGRERIRRRRSSAGRTPTGSSTPASASDDQTIGWDRGELLPELKDNFGDMGVTMVLAHEYGHAFSARPSSRRRTPRRWSPNSRPTVSQGRTCAGSPRTIRRASPCPPAKD